MLNKCILALFFFCFYACNIDAKHHHKHDKDKEFVNLEMEAWSRAYNMHVEHANNYYNEAKIMCLELCEKASRDKALETFASACDFIQNSKPSSRLIHSITSYLMVFGLDKICEWDYIREKLTFSVYHYEMSEFYKDMLEEMNSLIIESKKT